MAEERQDTPPQTTDAEGGTAPGPGPENGTSGRPGEPAPAPTAGSQPTAEAPPDQVDEAPTAQPATDVWAPIDVVLQSFAAERRVAPGTFWGESPTEVEGRFVGWANASGWRCTLQLVLAPQENVVVLVAQGPPLPGGRARMMVLGAFPPDFDHPTLRAALEVGYSIGETWGPADEPPPTPPAAQAGQAPEQESPTG